MKGDTVAQKKKGVARRIAAATLVEELATLYREVYDAVSVISDTKTRSVDTLLIGQGYTALDRSLFWALQSKQIDGDTRDKLKMLQSKVWKQLSRIEIIAGIVDAGA